MANPESTPGVVFRSDSCANCNAKFTELSGNEDNDINNVHIIEKATEFEINSGRISNFQALHAIYKAEFMVKESAPECKKDSPETEIIAMCIKCTLALADLHRFFNEFVNLSSQTSSLQQMVSQSLNWIQQQRANVSSTKSVQDPSSKKRRKRQPFTIPVIQVKKVKKEPLEMEDIKIVPDLPDYDDNFYFAHNASNFNSEDEFGDLDEERDRSFKTLENKKLTVSIEPLELHKLESKLIETSDAGETISSRKTYLINKQQLRKDRRKLLRRKRKMLNATSGVLKTKSCNICSKMFRDSKGLSRHKLVHTDEKKFACPECPKAYKERKLLNRHMNVKHGVGGKLPDRTCQICGLYFSLPSLLRTHTKSVHSSAKPYCCEYCGQSFPTINYLKIHLKARHEGKAYKCDLCDKVLTSKNGIRAHMEMIHLNEKKFTCEICGKKFYRVDWLKKHLQTHEENRERTIKCKYCDTMFYTQSSCRNHEIKHTLQANKLCSHCGAPFKNKSSLVRHIESRHTEGETHSCELCGKVFKLREYLIQHMRSKTHGGLGHYAERVKNGTTTRVIPKITPLDPTAPASTSSSDQHVPILGSAESNNLPIQVQPGQQQLPVLPEQVVFVTL